ncbi:MAG: 4-hydroxy-tetrahydrodipicolinate reductase, partial [Dehalococcoidia bacterium]
MTIRVAVSGSGNMGRQVIQALSAADDIEVVGVLDKLSQGDTVSLAGAVTLPLRQTVKALSEYRADVLVDFSNAAWTQDLVPFAVEAGVRPVVGTSGLPDAFVADVEKRCEERSLGAVIASNFAMGAVLMMH